MPRNCQSIGYVRIGPVSPPLGPRRRGASLPSSAHLRPNSCRISDLRRRLLPNLVTPPAHRINEAHCPPTRRLELPPQPVATITITRSQPTSSSPETRPLLISFAIRFNGRRSACRTGISIVLTGEYEDVDCLACRPRVLSATCISPRRGGPSDVSSQGGLAIDLASTFHD